MAQQTVTSQPTVVTSITSQGGTITVNAPNDWQTGIFGCFEDITTCLCGLFCFPCLLCRTSAQMGEHYIMPFCCPLGVVAMRTKLRMLRGIQGSICWDSLAMELCGPCAVCQMKREMDKAGW
ncbi:placenta-specific gene 8 protein [Lingula anatina]|uniref:Placenta-specific gene 8 protein n=1 Tax=Lingula anatina TaxID=7574 RepID=A0A1S3IIE8_LINAN|nr:placenta-specific gene 8 protein [Lingula anatina]|eukprot:XP_013397898.1 placenta-specific gene 8 protein [Lingula anatina]